jgi:hypothetical protein
MSPNHNPICFVRTQEFEELDSRWPGVSYLVIYSTSKSPEPRPGPCVSGSPSFDSHREERSLQLLTRISRDYSRLQNQINRTLTIPALSAR